MAESKLEINTNNIISCHRVVRTVTTGSTGNIDLAEINDGYTFIVAPIIAGASRAVRVWVSGSSNNWYATVIDPNSGATVNNTSVDLRYWVIKTYSAN